MWEFMTQNWWTFLFIAIMVYMHRKGGAGCCGGGMHGHNHNSKKELQDTNIEGSKEPQDTNIREASCCSGQKSI